MPIERPLVKGVVESNSVSCLFQHPEVHGVCTIGRSRDTGTPAHFVPRVVTAAAGHCWSLGLASASSCC